MRLRFYNLLARGTSSAGIALALAMASRTAAQDASLLQFPQAVATAGPLTLEVSSFMFQKIPPEAEQRELRVNDIITVLVDYRTSMQSEGDAENRKRGLFDFALTDWIKFDGNDIFVAPQTRGDPGIAGAVNSQFRAESELELRDALTFRIAAHIVDIQPNGNLVIEAHRHVRINEEVWEQSLTGIVRRSSIGPDRTVRSDEIADLRIEKRELGFIRDSYSRGWLQRWYGRWKPF